MSEVKKFWAIFPIYNEESLILENKWKLCFYDTKYTIDQLFENPIKPSIHTNLLVKFGK